MSFQIYLRELEQEQMDRRTYKQIEFIITFELCYLNVNKKRYDKVQICV